MPHDFHAPCDHHNSPFLLQNFRIKAMKISIFQLILKVLKQPEKKMKFFLTIFIIAFLAFNSAQAGGDSGCPDCTGLPRSYVCARNSREVADDFNNSCHVDSYNCANNDGKFLSAKILIFINFCSF